MQSKHTVGVDEAGRGPLFGRVYAAAVILPEPTAENKSWMSLIKDSKRFHSAVKIRQVADNIRKHAISYGVGWRDEKRIDVINILQATQEAMHDAIDQVIKSKDTVTTDATVKLLIDGNYFRPYAGLQHHCIEQGDNIYPCIAAASILAKVARDDYIHALCKEYPELVHKYDLDKNKGYGTKRHMDGIREHGVTEWHRKSFRCM